MHTTDEIVISIANTANTIVLDNETSTITIYPCQSEWTNTVALFNSDLVERFIHDHVPGIADYIELALVPEPENTYDHNAVAVVLPSSIGGPPEERRIGYLLIQERANSLAGLLAETQRYSGHEVRCFGRVYRNNGHMGHIELLLPRPGRMEEDLTAYVKECRRRGGKLIPSSEVPAQEHELSSFVKRYITYFEKPVSQDSIELETGFPGRDEIRGIDIYAGKGRKFIGSVSHGMLELDDERRRDEIAKLLREAGISFAPPLEQFPFDVPDADRTDKGTVPNIRMRIYEGYIAFELEYRENYGPFLLLAEYNRTTEELWLQARAIADGVLNYVARIGLPVSSVRFPESPWWLEKEVHFSDRRDYSRKIDARKKSGKPLLSGEYPDEFFVREKHVLSRTSLFPTHRLILEAAQCRLCKQDSAIFTVPFCSSPLSYCSVCLNQAARGELYRKADPKEIIKELTGLEFAGIPPLPNQLVRVNSIGFDDVSAQDIDRMLSLRAYIRPKAKGSSWVALLAEAGLIDDGIRLSRGMAVVANDGHLCRSLHEKAVDDFLHHHEIAHELEPSYPHDVDLNSNTRKRADWLLEDGTFVEMWGMQGDSDYDVRTEQKLAIAEKHSINLIGIGPGDVTRLSEIFRRWI